MLEKSDFFQNFFILSNLLIDLCHAERRGTLHYIQDDNTLLTRNSKDMFTLLECVAYFEVT